MNKEFVPYQEALELKELGFDEPCFAYRESTFGKEKVIVEPSGLITNTNFSKIFGETRFRLVTPTFSKAFRWFRDKYKLHHSIDYECSQHDHTWGYNWSIYNYNQVVKTDEEYITSHPDAPAGEWVYDSDGEAELACLRKLIEIVKNC